MAGNGEERNNNIKLFDLNIEKILEDWEVYHAIREIIANALDEQILTKTKPIKIFKDSRGRWHIRDFGRGLKYEHLTQKENVEKLENPHVIGKFGIGLKDALATFYRKGVKVEIVSKHCIITLGIAKKHGFDDIETLHAIIHPPEDPNFVGTDVILEGVSDEDIEKAKNLFLVFSGERVIEKTKWGEVLEKKGEKAKIYMNGVRVAEEENFLFSYNITSLTRKIKKALNRERTNVGRSAYSDRVKKILLSCKSKEVAELLVRDLQKYFEGKHHDELKWIDVQVHVVKILNSLDKVIFLTPDEMMGNPFIVDEARRMGYKIVAIPAGLKEKIRGLKDIAGNTVRDIDQFCTEYEQSFEFKFVDVKDLTDNERKIFEQKDKIFSLIGGKPRRIKKVLISETMRKDLLTGEETAGLWIPIEGTIIVKRSTLKNLEDFAGVLLHETAHAISGADDISREFEDALTNFLGKICTKALTISRSSRQRN